MDRHSTTDRPIGAGRNTGIGPSFWTLDLRLTRSIRVGDRGRIEIMGEAFNLFNNLNYKTVNNTVGTNMVGSLSTPRRCKPQSKPAVRLYFSF